MSRVHARIRRTLMRKEAGFMSGLKSLGQGIKSQASSLTNDIKDSYTVGKAFSNQIPKMPGVKVRGRVRAPNTLNLGISVANKTNGLVAGMQQFAAKRPQLTEFANNMLF